MPPASLSIKSRQRWLGGAPRWARAPRGPPLPVAKALRVAEQLAVYGDSWISSFAEERGCSDSTSAAAAAAFRDTAVWLTDVYAQQADPADAVGEERYLRAAAAFNGIELTSTTPSPGVGTRSTDSVAPCAPKWTSSSWAAHDRGDSARLDADPAYQIQGIPALVDHLTSLTRTATERVDGELFDIDPRVREVWSRSPLPVPPPPRTTSNPART